MSCQIFLIFSCFTHDPWLIYAQLTTHTHRMRMCERRRHRDIILFYAFQYAWEKMSPLHVKIHICYVINYSIEQFKVDEWLEIRHDHGDEEEEKNHESITNERKSNFLTTKWNLSTAFVFSFYSLSSRSDSINSVYHNLLNRY